METTNESQTPKFTTWQEAVGELNNNFSEMLKMYSQMVYSVKALGEGADKAFTDVYKRVKVLEDSKPNQGIDLQQHIQELHINVKALGDKLASTTHFFESYNKMFSFVQNELQSSRNEIESIKEILKANKLV